MRGETDAHRRLKRLAVIWAQAHGYNACAVEVSLPRSRYRADVAAYRQRGSESAVTAVFECKQVLSDLRRDNCCSRTARERLATVDRRREILERHLRIHYPHLRAGESLFPEFDRHDFSALEHRSYRRVLRELAALQNRIADCTKFECLTRYRCANLFFLVLPDELERASEIPPGWGALLERNGVLVLERKPIWHDASAETQLRLLQRVAAAGTRYLNRQLEITFETVAAERLRNF